MNSEIKSRAFVAESFKSIDLADVTGETSDARLLALGWVRPGRNRRDRSNRRNGLAFLATVALAESFDRMPDAAVRALSCRNRARAHYRNPRRARDFNVELPK